MESAEMRTRILSLAPLGGVLLLLAVASLLFASPAMADLPPSPCTSNGTTTTCELWATTGQLIMPDGVIIPTWGFAASAGVSATVPGPLLLGTQGETMVVTLHNELAGERVSLVFPGQPDLFPDLVGVVAGGSKSYSFSLDNPGTFLYEAGLTENGARQVAMGLYGALVVRPLNPTQAYDDPLTAFSDEALLVLSEIDPSFNSDPAGFQMHTYEPRYWLINGKAYPETDAIPTLPGNTVLLRYINAGLKTHGMSLLGLQQRIIASDGKLVHAYSVVAEKIVSGETMDALVNIPAGVEMGTRYALYESNLSLHNASQRVPNYKVYLPIVFRTGGTASPTQPGAVPVSEKLAFGGMMTFIAAGTGADQATTGPLVTKVQLVPNPTAGGSGVTLSATIDDSLTGGLDVVAAEYYIDGAGLPGTGIPLVITTPAQTVTVSENIPAAALALLPSGYRVFYVRGQDSGGSWGPVGSGVLNLDKEGPAIIGMTLDPEPSNGSKSVLLLATGDDHANGNNGVVSGEYSIDGGPAAPMTLDAIGSPITAMTATLPISTFQVMAEGLHPIAITAVDSLGNVGAAGIITLTLDQTGPATPTVTITPTLLDLTEPLTVTVLRLDAVITDSLSAGVQSPLVNAEAFIDTVGPEGTGFALFPSDGEFNTISEHAYFEIPISSFLYLGHGYHPIWVRGLDKAGNWGTVGYRMLKIHLFDVNAVRFLPLVYRTE
jgi:FtsP/CotA-like multicopper oxidase with cupredoxin domain